MSQIMQSCMADDSPEIMSKLLKPAALILLCLSLSGCGTVYYNAAYRTDADAKAAFARDQMRCSAYADGLAPMPRIYTPDNSTYQFEGSINGPGFERRDYYGTIERVPSPSEQMVGIASSMLAIAAMAHRKNLHESYLAELGWSTDKELVNQRIAEMDARIRAEEEAKQAAANAAAANEDPAVMAAKLDKALGQKSASELQTLDCRCGTLLNAFVSTVPMSIGTPAELKNQNIAMFAFFSYVMDLQTSRYSQAVRSNAAEGFDPKEIFPLCLRRAWVLGEPIFKDKTKEQMRAIAKKRLKNVLSEKKLEAVLESIEF